MKETTQTSAELSAELIAALPPGFWPAKVIDSEILLKKLKSGKPLKIKFGADPTAPDLHLGHTVVLRALRKFQDMGHIVQFLIGDFTTMIGDPSGRSATRPALTPEEIKVNAATYQEQAFMILDKSKTEVVYNNDWLGKMNFADVIRLASKYTVARILERDDFEKRLAEKKPISLHELLYPLVQGWDSVVLKSDIEFCGTDQIFNCLVARALQSADGQVPEAIIAVPLIEGTDGVKKMSKSYDNYVALKDPPKEWFGKLMSVPDTLMEKYFKNLTDTDSDDQKKILAGHPREAKAIMARAVMAPYFDEKTIAAAANEFDRVFKDGVLPDEIGRRRLTATEKDLPLHKLLVAVKMANSNGEARRLVEQGGVKIDQKPEQDANRVLVFEKECLLSVGKRKNLWLER